MIISLCIYFYGFLLFVFLLWLLSQDFGFLFLEICYLKKLLMSLKDNCADGLKWWSLLNLIFKIKLIYANKSLCSV